MAKPTSIRDAIAKFQTDKGVDATKAEKVELYGQCPPIEKMDASLNMLQACKHLALSTNNIEKIAGLSGLTRLEVLSLGRNLIKKLDGLEPVAASLQKLWMSYNSVEKLAGIEKLPGLRVLYLGNNKIKDWGEVDRLAALEQLEEVLLLNNPIQAEIKSGTEGRSAIAEYRVEVLRRLPKLKKLDGAPIDVEEREAAAKPRVPAE